MSVCSSGPTGLRLCPVPPSLDCLNSLGTTAFFSSLSKAGVHYVPARPCRLIAVYLLLFLLYLNRPLCAISCLTIAIYTIPLSPLKPIEGVRGIYLYSTTILYYKVSGIYIFRYLLYLGPSYQALIKGHYSLKRDRKTIQCYPGCQVFFSI